MKKYLGWITLAALCACSSGGGATPPAPGADAGTPEADAGPDPVVGRPGRGITLSVVDAGSPAFVLQGKTLDVKLKLERQIASAGAVTVTVKGLPKDATSAGVVIPAGALEGTLTIQSAAATPQGPSDVVLEAAESDGSLASAKLPLFVRGAPGTLDTTFAKAGVYSPIFGALLGALASDAVPLDEGKTLIGGRRINTVSVTRLGADGVLDATFAGGGIQDVASRQGELRVAQQPATSAKKGFVSVLEIGSTPSLHMLAPNGQLDTGFNGNGKRVLDVGPAGLIIGNDIHVLPNGKILVLAVYGGLPGGKGLGVSRWNLDGSLDTTYGSNPPGFCAITVAGTGSTSLNGGFMLPSADGSVRVVAVAASAAPTSIVKGCTATGALDTTLGAAPDHVWDLGALVTDATREADGTMTALTADAWYRYNSAGVLDQSIGNVGKVTVSTTAQLAAVRVQADKKVLVAGGEGPAFKLFRFLPTGSLDPSFGTAGVLSVDVAPDNTAELKRLTLLPDDRALLVGTRNDLPDGAVVRLWR